MVFATLDIALVTISDRKQYFADIWQECYKYTFHISVLSHSCVKILNVQLLAIHQMVASIPYFLIHNFYSFLSLVTFMVSTAVPSVPGDFSDFCFLMAFSWYTVLGCPYLLLPILWCHWTILNSKLLKMDTYIIMYNVIFRHCEVNSF